MGRTRKSEFVSADDFIAGLSPSLRARVEARATELIAEELTLRDLRKARDLTQVELGKKLGIGQEQISRIEQRADMLLSTIASYVAAMGGSLELVAKFPDRPNIVLAGLGDVLELEPAVIADTSHAPSASANSTPRTAKRAASRARKRNSR